MSRALESLRPSSAARRPLPNAIRRIEQWLRSKIGRAPSISIEPRSTGEGGFSGELYFIRVQSEGAPREREYVLRRRGGADSLFPDADFSIQHRILRALREAQGVPVPEVVWVEEKSDALDAPFFVMERIHGDVPAHFGVGGWLAEAKVEQRRRMWESGIRVLARIHDFDWQAADLDIRRGTAGQTELAADIDYWRDLYERGSDRAFRDLLGLGFDWLSSSMPLEDRLCLCWGDARHQNMIFRDFECAAVLDWEMATLGSPEKDISFLLSVDRNLAEAGLSRLEGLLSERETIALYESESGRLLANMEFYEAFAIVRALVMQARFMKLGLMPCDPDALRDNISGRQLRRFLAERLERVPEIT
jgi:aminoglycoside phosphotransferase (APT) family kinase protein